MKEFTHVINDPLGLHARPAGLLAKLAKPYADTVITITKGDKEWRVVLKPERGKGAAKIAEVELIFNRKDMSLDSLKMVEKSGDYTMYTFRNKQFNMTK